MYFSSLQLFLTIFKLSHLCSRGRGFRFAPKSLDSTLVVFESFISIWYVKCSRKTSLFMSQMWNQPVFTREPDSLGNTHIKITVWVLEVFTAIGLVFCLLSNYSWTQRSLSPTPIRKQAKQVSKKNNKLTKEDPTTAEGPASTVGHIKFHEHWVFPENVDLISTENWKLGMLHTLIQVSQPLQNNR